MLPSEAINKFKELYFQHYKVELSDEEASYRANNLMSLYDAVYGNQLVKSSSLMEKTSGQLPEERASPDQDKRESEICRCKICTLQDDL